MGPDDRGATAQLRDEISRFVKGVIDPTTFDHEAHVRMAYAMSRHHSFDVALLRFARALRSLARRAGKRDKFNMTITVAFLSLVAERCAREPQIRWPEFVERNRDLLQPDRLRAWYAPADLMSAVSRKTFVLPTRSPRIDDAGPSLR